MQGREQDDIATFFEQRDRFYELRKQSPRDNQAITNAHKTVMKTYADLVDRFEFITTSNFRLNSERTLSLMGFDENGLRDWTDQQYAQWREQNPSGNPRDFVQQIQADFKSKFNQRYKDLAQIFHSDKWRKLAKDWDSGADTSGMGYATFKDLEEDKQQPDTTPEKRLNDIISSINPLRKTATINELRQEYVDSHAIMLASGRRQAKPAAAEQKRAQAPQPTQQEAKPAAPPKEPSTVSFEAAIDKFKDTYKSEVTKCKADPNYSKGYNQDQKDDRVLSKLYGYHFMDQLQKNTAYDTVMAYGFNYQENMGSYKANHSRLSALMIYSSTDDTLPPIVVETGNKQGPTKCGDVQISSQMVGGAKPYNIVIDPAQTDIVLQRFSKSQKKYVDSDGCKKPAAVMGQTYHVTPELLAGLKRCVEQTINSVNEALEEAQATVSEEKKSEYGHGYAVIGFEPEEHDIAEELPLAIEAPPEQKGRHGFFETPPPEKSKQPEDAQEQKSGMGMGRGSGGQGSGSN